jgi:hypothetical protein
MPRMRTTNRDVAGNYTHPAHPTLAVTSPTCHELAKTASLHRGAPWPRLRSRFAQGFNVRISKIRDTKGLIRSPGTM